MFFWYDHFSENVLFLTGCLRGNAGHENNATNLSKNHKLHYMLLFGELKIIWGTFMQIYKLMNV